MKKFLQIILVFFLISCTQENDYNSQIEKVRKDKDAEFLNPSTSPFNAEELKNFKGFPYFDIDAKYKVHAILKRMPNMPYFDMPHSNNKTRSYHQFGSIEFVLLGKKFVLPVFTNENFEKEHELFFPFHDLTNGKETYGGGRFMDIKYSDNSDDLDLDFNLCYHPYCARSHRFTCPIVQKESSIDMEVRAGEKL